MMRNARCCFPNPKGFCCMLAMPSEQKWLEGGSGSDYGKDCSLLLTWEKAQHTPSIPSASKNKYPSS